MLPSFWVTGRNIIQVHGAIRVTKVDSHVGIATQARTERGVEEGEGVESRESPGAREKDSAVGSCCKG